MKLQSLKCPNCNAVLEVEDGIDTFFCKYCGNKIILSDMSDTAYNAKVRIEAMKHIERMQSKKYEQYRYKIAKKKSLEKRKFIIGLIIAFVYCLGLCSIFLFTKNASNKEEKKLQSLVEEIMVDIDNGNFENAKIKANTLYYTTGWSSTIEEKWDETREAVLKQINDSEKANKGSFFDLFN